MKKLKWIFLFTLLTTIYLHVENIVGLGRPYFSFLSWLLGTIYFTNRFFKEGK